MGPQVDHESGEIGVFEAARYFSEYSLVKTQPKMKALDLPKIVQSNSVHPKANQKKINKAKEPTSPGARLATLFNSLFFHHSTSKKNKPKPLESPVPDDAPKSNSLSLKRNQSLKHHFECNDGFNGEMWRDRRLEGIRVVGKRWVLSNSANYEGLFRKGLFMSEMELSENETKNNEDDGSFSDASSDLFELGNYN